MITGHPGGALRVGILVPRLSGGGAEFVAGQWASYLHGHGVEVTLITTHSDADEQPGLPVVHLPRRGFAGRVLQLRRHATTDRYDVVLALMPHWNVLALLAVLGRRARPAVVISGRNAETALRSSQGRAYRTELRLSRLLYPRADAYVAISHPVAAEAAASYRLAADRIWVVPNPAAGKLAGSCPAVRPARGHSTGQSVTLTLPARLVPQKCPEMAVEVAAILAREHHIRASVDYFGSGLLQARIAEHARALGVPVRFRGWVTSWFDETAADAVVLLPSVAEGFGNVLVEAAGVGVPSVASSRALGVADAIVPSVTGVLCMGASAVDFADAVLAAMELSVVPPAGWLERFSPQESGRHLLRVLQEVTDVAA